MRSNSLVRRSMVICTAALWVSACSDGGDDTLARAEVEQEAAAQLAAAVGLPEPEISCPGDLAAEVGASIECELRADDDPSVYAVHVEVVEVEDGDARLDFEVADEPIE